MGIEGYTHKSVFVVRPNFKVRGARTAWALVCSASGYDWGREWIIPYHH